MKILNGLLLVGVLVGCTGPNYELLTKEGEPVWKVSFGHAQHDGAYTYEDADRNGHWDHVMIVVDFVSHEYILVSNESEQKDRETEIIMAWAAERRQRGEDFQTQPGLVGPNAEHFYPKPGTDNEYATFVVKGSSLDLKLQKEFENAARQ